MQVYLFAFLKGSSSQSYLAVLLKAYTSSDASLTDEANGIITFLDGCIQHCLKTPYRYIEELYGFNSTADSDAQRLDVYYSPLFMAVLEQLSIKVEKKISPISYLGVHEI